MDGGRRERGPANGRDGGERAHNPWLGDSGDASGVNLLDGVRVNQKAVGEREGGGAGNNTCTKNTHTHRNDTQNIHINHTTQDF